MIIMCVLRVPAHKRGAASRIPAVYGMRLLAGPRPPPPQWPAGPGPGSGPALDSNSQAPLEA